MFCFTYFHVAVCIICIFSFPLLFKNISGFASTKWYIHCVCDLHTHKKNAQSQKCTYRKLWILCEPQHCMNISKNNSYIHIYPSMQKTKVKAWMSILFNFSWNFAPLTRFSCKYYCPIFFKKLWFLTSKHIGPNYHTFTCLLEEVTLCDLLLQTREQVARYKCLIFPVQ